MTDRQATAELLEALHAHYIAPKDRHDLAGAGAVFLTEVTAPNSTRRADAVHVGLWQSRGAGDVDVHELKVSRADWRRELDKPAKAEAWWPYSTRFWVVAPSTAIVPPEELPDGWGLMVPNPKGRRFKKIVTPEAREPELSIGLLLTLLKSTETTRTNAIRDLERAYSRQQVERERKLRQELAGTADPESKRRLDALAELEKVLGFEIGSDAWRGKVEPHLVGGAIAKFVQGEQVRSKVTNDFDYEAQALQRLSEKLGKAAAELREAAGVSGPSLEAVRRHAA